MGYPTDDDFAEAHGWRKDRPALRDIQPQPESLSFATLRIGNLRRLPEFRDAKGRLCHSIDQDGRRGFDWTLSQWSNATLGELGEAANLIKKIERGDFTLEEKRAELADELCDVVTYLDLLAHRAGIDLGEATIAKWNRISERVGSRQRIGPRGCYQAEPAARAAEGE